MSIHTKKDGRIFVVYRENGKQVWEAFGRGPEAEKAAKTRDLKVKLAKLTPEPRPLRQGAFSTFTEIAQSYLNARSVELAPRTINEIFQFLDRYIVDALGKKSVDDIDMQDWEHLQAEMIARKAGARTINTYFTYLNGIWEWAVLHGHCRNNPWEKRKRLKQKKFHIQLLTMKEFQAILEVAPDHLAWCLEVSYHTGCRPGPTELFALKWSDVDWDRRAIRIYAPKTDTYREQFLSPGFIARMETRSKKQSEEYPENTDKYCPYICHYQGKQIGSLKTAWETAKKEAGIPHPARLYDLRHYYITYALASGADIMDLAERVGHANAGMIVNVYAHLAKDLRTGEALTIPEYDFTTVSSRVPTPSEIMRRVVEKKKTAKQNVEGNQYANDLLDKTLDKKEKGVNENSLTP
jgi:integrase